MIVPVGRRTLLVTGAFGLFVLGLLTVLPFWLDEVLQLVGTHPGSSARELLAYIPTNPGGVPLGYFVQHWTLEALGLSRWSARLPSAIFGVAACLGTALLALRIHAGVPWVSAALFALAPSMLRYSTEGRPYSMGVFLSVAGTILFLRLADRRTAGSTAAYGAVLLAGVFTQPFTIFCGAAHGFWALARRDRDLAARVLACGLGAGAAFAPWVLWSTGAWNQTIESSRFTFAWDWRTPLMLFREIPGAGYWGSGALVLLCISGWRALRDSRAQRLLLGLLIAVPLVGGLLADWRFGYFIASRQFLWILPPVAVLASAGAHALGRWGLVLAAVLAVAGSAKCAKYFSTPAEDWEAAALSLSAELSKGGCLAIAPPASAYIYEFVAPDLRQRRCREGSTGRAVIAVPPYSTAGEERTALGGRAVERTLSVGGTRILVTRNE